MATVQDFIKEIKSNYVSPISVDETLAIPSVKDTVIPKDYVPPYTTYVLSEAPSVDKGITITDYAGNETIIASDNNTSGEYKFSSSGPFIIRYKGAIRKLVANNTEAELPFNISFTIMALVDQKTPPKHTVTDVIRRVLRLAEPHLVGEASRYKLDAEQATQFAAIEAPEFAFTNMTLKQALDHIGSYIHGIPRLIKGASGRYDTIKYDMLGGRKKAPLADPKYPYITNIKAHSIESYATALDSTVDNLVNTLNSGEGAIIEPYRNGFKSVRSEEAYARITEGNMVIATAFPIASVQKLEVLTPQNNAADITAYVFEGTDYGRLSSFEGSYPTSKAYAIYYEIGQKNIRGLSFKTPNIYGEAFANYAITNIIKATTGEDISSSWWADITLDGVLKSGNYPKLKFRITYTPVFSARVRQYKSYIGSNTFKRTLTYNQGANLVETRYYGENLKGTIARMGNVRTLRTYQIGLTALGLSLMPKIGQLWDNEYYVSGVTNALYHDHIDCTVELSKDFNRLSEYIGINAEWRSYEVSGRSAYNRDMVYEDFAVIGDAVESDGKALLTDNGIAASAFSFVSSVTVGVTYEPVSAVYVATYVQENLQARVTLPVISAAFGNAMVFSFKMADNFSAGAKSVYGSNGEVSGYWQTDVQYSDYFGRFDSAGIAMTADGENNYNSTTPFDLPNGNLTSGLPYIETRSGHELYVDKDSREIWGLNYAVHFVSNRRDIIIGSGLARNNRMLNSTRSRGCSLFVCQNEIGKFDTHIDMSASTPVFNYTIINAAQLLLNGIVIDVENRQIRFLPRPATVSGSAWAIADKTTGEIFIARNRTVTAGQAISLPTITFTHNLS